MVNSAQNSHKALIPCENIKTGRRCKLSARLENLKGKTIYLVAPNQKGSHIEFIMDIIKSTLVERYADISVIFKNKPNEYSKDDPEFWDEIVKNADAFVYGGAPSSSTTHWSVTWGAKLEKMGCPGCMIIYSELEGPLTSTVEALGLPIRYIKAKYPPQTMQSTEMNNLVSQVVENLTATLTSDEKIEGLLPASSDMSAFFIGTNDEIQDYFLEKKWTDGLPIIVPTEEKVQAMLDATSHSPDEIVATTMWPEKLSVSVKKVAINGVMAGCRPEYMPALLASVEAFANGDYHSSIRSTNAFSYLQVVNGPIRSQLDMNSGTYALGPGNKANATIGRFLRLAIINLGRARIGINVMSTQGNPSAYGFCFAENEEGSPWKSLSVSHGFKEKESTVSMFHGGWSHVGNYLSGDLDQLIRDITVFEWPAGVTVFMSPKAADMQFAKGLDKDGVEQYIWENATITAKEFREGLYYSWFVEPMLRRGLAGTEEPDWPTEYLTCPDNKVIPMYPRKAVKVIVVGGQANPMMQAWKNDDMSTVSIDKWR